MYQTIRAIKQYTKLNQLPIFIGHPFLLKKEKFIPSSYECTLETPCELLNPAMASYQQTPYI